MITNIEEFQENTRKAYGAMEHNDNITAINLFNKSIAAIPDPVLVNTVGVLYHKIGKSELASKVFAEILGTKPTSKPAMINYVETICSLENVGPNDIKYAISMIPTHPKLWIKLAQYYKKIGKNLKELSTLRLAISIIPNDVELHRMLGQIYVRYQYIEEAKNEFNTVLNLSEKGTDTDALEQLLKLSKLNQTKQLNVGIIMGLYPFMQEVHCGVFIGSQSSAANLNELKKYNITHILNVATEIPNFFENSKEITIEYLHVQLLDSSQESIVETGLLDRCIKFMEDSVLKGGHVLVHCQAGMSRSGAVAVAYVMKHSNLSYQEALNRVRSIRQCVCPNIGFAKQLETWKF